MVYSPDKSEEDNDAYIKMMMESPLRMIPSSGMKEGVALANSGFCQWASYQRRLGLFLWSSLMFTFFIC
jgi:hypothetical protein